MRVCPLFFASAADLEEFECRLDRCAWACNDTCAVVSIAASLNALATECIENDRFLPAERGE